MWFSAERPDDYKGRGLAISDVLSIKRDDSITSYFANGRTFKELLDFNGEEGRMSKREVVIEMVDDAVGMKGEAATASHVLETAQPTPQNQTQAETEPPTTQQPQAQQDEIPPPQEPALPVIKSDSQMYRYSAKEADSYGAMDVYNLSRRLDVDCAEAITKAITANKKGENRYDLATPAASLLKTYGAERMTWVLSKHLLAATKKFSEGNYAWAIAFVDDGTGSGDPKPAFEIKIHHAVLDAFITHFRAALAKKPTFTERMKAAKKKSDAHNKANG